MLTPPAGVNSQPPRSPDPSPRSFSTDGATRRVTLRNLRNAIHGRGPVLYWWIVPVLLGVASLALLYSRAAQPDSIARPQVPYSELAAALAAGAVSDLSVEKGGTKLIATLRSDNGTGRLETRTLESTVPMGVVSLADMDRWSATGAKVRVAAGGPSNKGDLAIQLLSLFAVLGVLAFIAVRQRGGIGTTRFVATPPSRHLTLADVGGASEAQADLRDVIAYLKYPARFRAMGARCPQGVLLIGPPGTGKTLLARAVAGEAGCPVIVAAGSDFNEMYVGVGSRRVRALAKQAREQAPCIVFIDEFDSLGGRRGRPNRSGEEEVTLNQLLVEMDGMAANDGVVWMAATNRDDMLDPAVRRPGRFDRVVEVHLPTAADRLAILRIHAGKSRFAPEVDLERLSLLTVGHSGADLANLLNEAAIIAVQQEGEWITAAHVEQARDKILLGRVRAGVVITSEEQWLIALHEAGHAIVGMIACPEDKLHKVTIEPRGRSLGAAHFAPEQDRHVHPRRYLEGLIAKALGGRAAELVFLGADAVTSGAGADLVQATNVARKMVAEFGMSEEVGLISADPAANGGVVSAQLQSQIDSAVRTLLGAQAARAESLVRTHSAAVEAVALALIEREVLTAEQVHAIATAHGISRKRSDGPIQTAA